MLYMNTIKKLFYALLALPILLTGCDKNFDEINNSPNSTTKVPTPYVLTYAQRQLGYNTFDVWNSGRQSLLCAQYWAQRNYTSEDRYIFRQGTTDAFSRNTYFNLQNFQDIINLNTNADTKAAMSVYGDNAVQIATSKLMIIWAVEMLAETFGDVPYTEALQIGTILQPKYDKQSTLFPKLLADAKTAVDALKTAQKGWTQGDVMFGGDIDKWIKFGNSLRLRLVVRQSNVKSDWKTVAKAIIAEGVMESNDDNAVIQFSGPGAPNEAPLYNGFIVGKRNDFTLTKQFVGLLNGVNDTDKGYTNPFAGLVDPRFRIYIGASNYNVGRTMGVPYGMPDADTKQFVASNTAKVISLYRLPSPLIIQADFWSVFIDYATVEFMKCEVNDWDKASFEAAMRASFEQWGVKAADEYGTADAYNAAVDTYVTGVLAKFDAATTAGKQEIVLTQKYMHLFTQGFEAWSEYRRTGFPKSIVKPGEVTNGTITFVASNPTGTDIVPRLLYDSNEYTLNKANVEAAATSIGGDKYNTKLWWAK